MRADCWSSRPACSRSGTRSPARCSVGPKGGWVDACLTPDGESVLAADMAGNLHLMSVAAGLRGGVEYPADAPVIGVATDGRVLLAAFARLPGLRERPLLPPG